MNYNLIEKIRKEKPLVHHITNIVTINECANITLCTGALPVMANAPEEVAEMVEHAGALVINIGTLNREQIEAMYIAGTRANELNIPVVIDPVGVGATTLRTNTVINLLSKIKSAVIKGNPAEISILAGEGGIIKGVESVGEYSNIINTAKILAKNYNCTVVVSGKEDVVTNGNQTFLIANGHPLLGQVVGTGCMLASVIASFLGTKEDTLNATIQGLLAFEIAGELAAELDGVRGPGTFKLALLDELKNLKVETIEKRAKVRKG